MQWIISETSGNNFEQIRCETERYAKKKKKQENSDYDLQKEVKCTLAVSILTRYQKLPLKRINWGQYDVTGNSASHNTGRNKLEKFLQYFHVADYDDLPKETKISRVFEYTEKLKQNFKENCIYSKIIWKLCDIFKTVN